MYSFDESFCDRSERNLAEQGIMCPSSFFNKMESLLDFNLQSVMQENFSFLTFVMFVYSVNQRQLEKLILIIDVFNANLSHWSSFLYYQYVHAYVLNFRNYWHGSKY